MELLEVVIHSERGPLHIHETAHALHALARVTLEARFYEQ